MKLVPSGSIISEKKELSVYESDGLVASDPWDDITSADKDCAPVKFMGTYTIEQ